ncbi:unnamed protein product, partial [Arabidopsis halleri]
KFFNATGYCYAPQGTTPSSCFGTLIWVKPGGSNPEALTTDLTSMLSDTTTTVNTKS